MTRKFRVWLDSGANCQSKRETVVTLEELGLTDAEWDKFSEEDKEDAMRYVAFERSDWGYGELT